MPRRRPPIVILAMAALVVCVLAFQAVLSAYDASHLRYVLDHETLEIHHRQDQRIPYLDIQSVLFFPQSPALHRLGWGTDLGRARFGRYNLTGVGEVRMFASDVRGPLIVVRTAGGNFGLTPKDGEGFYRRLLAKIPKTEPPRIGNGGGA